MTRGFITVATGNKQYYQLAYNLLKSYRFFTNEPLPFAIIAEEENEFTKHFDTVILTNKAQHTFMDKLLVFENLPFDETIFIDSDSLAYGDLNQLWAIFKDATDFSAFGNNHDLYSDEKLTWWDACWYDIKGIGKYGEGVTCRCRVHAGVCFYRKSNKLQKMYDDCKKIIEDYDSLIIKVHPLSVDEASLAIACALNDMKLIREPFDIFGILHSVTDISPKIVQRKLEYITPWETRSDKCFLMHFGTASTKLPIYRFSVECIDYMIKYKDKKPPLWQKLKYEKLWRYKWLRIPYKSNFINKVLVKLKLKKFF